MYNWNSKNLLPKFFKSFMPDNLYNPKYLKNFIIVSMLRNYIIKNKNNCKENTIIMNKVLVTKPIDTSNLTINTYKNYKDPTENQYTLYKC